MRKSFRRYANHVIARIPADKKTKVRIREDILEMLEEKSSNRLEERPEDLLGSAHILAAEFCENLELSEPIETEYRSTREIMGIPLIHVTRSKFVTAKGIIAIGPSSIGIISIGGAAVGIVSIGGVAVGFISLGGLAVAALIAIGGLAISMNLAMGGFAVALSLAMGGYASAKEVAIGGITSAKVMFYNQSFEVPKDLSESMVKSFSNPNDSQAFTEYIKGFSESMNFLSRSILKMIFK